MAYTAITYQVLMNEAIQLLDQTTGTGGDDFEDTTIVDVTNQICQRIYHEIRPFFKHEHAVASGSIDGLQEWDITESSKFVTLPTGANEIIGRLDIDPEYKPLGGSWRTLVRAKDRAQLSEQSGSAGPYYYFERWPNMYIAPAGADSATLHMSLVFAATIASGRSDTTNKPYFNATLQSIGERCAAYNIAAELVGNIGDERAQTLIAKAMRLWKEFDIETSRLHGPEFESRTRAKYAR